MIKITFTVTDKETLENYKDCHPDIILDDFLNNLAGWCDFGRFKVTVKKEKK